MQSSGLLKFLPEVLRDHAFVSQNNPRHNTVKRSWKNPFIDLKKFNSQIYCNAFNTCDPLDARGTFLKLWLIQPISIKGD